MSVAEIIHQKVLALPVERQRDVLTFVERLEGAEGPQRPRIDPYGMLAGQIPDLSFDDFAKARRELWGHNPAREDI